MIKNKTFGETFIFQVKWIVRHEETIRALYYS